MPTETSPLSEREKDVARILLQGKSNKQIALELGISNRTVEFHLKNIYTKLGVASRTEAILKLTESDLWKTTGDLPVESTVEKAGDPAENEPHLFSRRLAMNKLYYILGGFLVTTLVVLLVVIDFTPQQVELTPTPVVPTSTVHVEVPTATVLVPTQTVEPEAERIVIPPHTVNGYTVTIESYVVDVSHVSFQLRLATESPDLIFKAGQIGIFDIYDEYGNLINSATGMQPAKDPELVELDFLPVILFKEDRVKGYLSFNVYAPPPDYDTIVAKFRFDFDLPIYPEVRFYPKQTVTANGIEILVDSVTVTPVYTQVYMCYQPPSESPWGVGNGTTIKIAGQEAPIYKVSGLFAASSGLYWGNEPYWVSPVKNGVCEKLGFQAGTSNPTSLTLIIPDFENILPFLTTRIDLDALYPGLNKRQAYHTYLDENGYTLKGPWVFNIELVP